MAVYYSVQTLKRSDEAVSIQKSSKPPNVVRSIIISRRGGVRNLAAMNLSKTLYADFAC